MSRASGWRWSRPALFIGVYTFRVAEEARQLRPRLNATELVLAREQHLSALDGLAAAAAHELGTPLATIALVAKELEREMPPGSPYAEDIALLNSQSQRCRDILAKLTSMSGEGDQRHRPPAAVAPDRGGGGALSRLRRRDRHRRAAQSDGPGAGRPRATRRSSTASPTWSRTPSTSPTAAGRPIGTEWTRPTRSSVTIADDGPGFAAGDPRPASASPTSPRGRAGRRRPAPITRPAASGLGFFIAKTLLERTGARADLRQQRAASDAAPWSGSAWPRPVMERRQRPDGVGGNHRRRDRLGDAGRKSL